MAPPLMFLDSIRLTFGGTPLLSGATLSVGQGERVALVGRNGSGKSTLLKIAAGDLAPDGGERIVRTGTTVRYLAQEPDLRGHATVEAFVAAGLAPGDDPERARRLIADLGLTGTEVPGRLSGGEARRAALARALAAAPDILLLDEPTNHLDLPAIEWLETTLSTMRSALVLISHDRRFLSTLSTATVWLDRGMTRRLDQGFAAFEAWRDDVLEQEERDRHKLDRKIAAEEDWVRYGVTARRKRNVGRMARLADLRTERREARRALGLAKLGEPTGELSGRLVIEAEGLAKSFGDRRIVHDLSIKIVRGDRIGIVGPNGAGKSTVLDLLTGRQTPDAGQLRLGANLQMVTLDQRRLSLDPATTLADTLTEGRGDQVMVAGRPRHVAGYLKDFLFQPEQARTPVGKLSGGERGRLMLARALASPGNLLVLDEPTNDLDLETLDLLQELLADYAGTLLLVSHDRDFLDRVVTSVLVADGNGRWIEYAGGYSDMLVQRGRAPGAKVVAADSAPKEKMAPPRRPAKAAKLGFAEKHALETLPKQMAALEAEIVALTTRLADPELFRRDPKAFDQATARLAAAESELRVAEDRWLELEMKREELGG